MSEAPDNLPNENYSLLDRVLRFCLENKLVVLLALILFGGWGVMVAPFDWDLGGLPRSPVPTDAIPDIGENQQIVFTEWMGRSPQDVEDQITFQLTVALLGIPGVQEIRSNSMFGFSNIFIIFDEGVEFYWSRSRVLEKLAALPPGTLPDGVRPTLGPDATALGQIYWYTLEGLDPDGNPAGGWNLHELRTVQDWYVRYALLAAEGISEVASVGGFQNEYQVDLDPDAMRAYDVSLGQVANAVRMANVDVGARTIEVNRVEYVIRGLGFIRSVEDIENTVVAERDNVPVRVKDVATVARGPALRRGALDKGGAEAVGGVAVVRYGFNPLAGIGNLKEKIDELAPGLPTKPVVDWGQVSRDELEAFAQKRGFRAFANAGLDEDAWLTWLRSVDRADWPEWITTSQVTVVPFYDRTELIYETLGTLYTALTEQILVTIIVVIVMVAHMRSSALISSALPLAVLMCFIAMKAVGVDANIVALSGIAISIGTIVDMSVIMCENVLRHLDEADESENRLEVVFRACREVASAVLTAVSTTIVSFLPVFAMTGAEGKLFTPLAYTKTFALAASVVVALTIVPAGAHLLFATRVRALKVKRILFGGLALAGVAVLLWLGLWILGTVMVAIGAWYLAADYLPARWKRLGPWAANAAAAILVGLFLSQYWEPLGPERGALRNLLFVGGLLGGLLGVFTLFHWAYAHLLRFFLAVKVLFLLVPALLVFAGLSVWLGPQYYMGPMNRIRSRAITRAPSVEALEQRGFAEREDGLLLWTGSALSADEDSVREALEDAGVRRMGRALGDWRRVKDYDELSKIKWEDLPKEKDAKFMTKVRWSIATSWDGLGREFMPPLDEGSFLWMPTTMPHASIGEAAEVLAIQDRAFESIPEVHSAVGKIGRAESPLDPAPVSMVETVINYHPEYVADSAGRRLTFRFDPGATDFFRDEEGKPLPAQDGQPYKVQGKFLRDEEGQLVPERGGMPFRLWRPALDPELNPGREAWAGVRSPRDIWDLIVEAGELPGTTSAPWLQPIMARIVMLQTGMRAPMGVKVFGPDLATVEQVGLQIEQYLREVPGVAPATVTADRIVGKPYIEIVIDRDAIARYGLHIRAVQDVVEAGLGGRRVTTTVEGRERYGVLVRYKRERRDRLETLGKVPVPAPGGAQIPLEQLAEIRYARGPMVIKSENTFLVGYVIFDMEPGNAEVDVVEAAQAYLDAKIASGEFSLPSGVSYRFDGQYRHQLRARRTLAVVLPLSLFLIFIILYLQFRAIPTSLLVFVGIAVAWSGGFMLLWFYGQPWFLNFSVFGVNMRDLFQIGPINLSVAVWVGFLALFGIVTDDGVVIATYLDQNFAARRTHTKQEIREATVAAGMQRVRPCLMTTATTILALLPVLTSTGRGADVMVPMAIPAFGGMLIELVTLFVVPVLYCAVQEFKAKFGLGEEATAEADSS